MFKRIAAAVGIGLFTLALAVPAFAHHAVGVSASVVCENGINTVSWEADIDGSFAGSYEVFIGETLVDGDDFPVGPSERSFDGSFVTTLTGTQQITFAVDFDGEEENQDDTVYTEVNIEECSIPTTTTTSTTSTSTTVPATTSTTTPSAPTTTPAPPTTVPIIDAPGAELADTGAGDALALIAAVGVSALILGLAYELGRKKS